MLVSMLIVHLPKPASVRGSIYLSCNRFRDLEFLKIRRTFLMNFSDCSVRYLVTLIDCDQTVLFLNVHEYISLVSIPGLYSNKIINLEDHLMISPVQLSEATLNH